MLSSKEHIILMLIAYWSNKLKKMLATKRRLLNPQKDRHKTLVRKLSLDNYLRCFCIQPPRVGNAAASRKKCQQFCYVPFCQLFQRVPCDMQLLSLAGMPKHFIELACGLHSHPEVSLETDQLEVQFPTFRKTKSR